ncbi:hypothetical protein JI721_15125 [Alicyclobacillus cycloheptanicus]|uniref:Uncharacterized protein n=1 Tax=Alicyclobacillus cycloheptanicus TaxID=1457 RepID=A0ABT9XD93_9BACL|nr:hypothetical protein [Alicyclobacillus cycloheptanicus]MDQ0188271.1 hypothetical protein [Alicyclobacillus cycloheptanicus]WDM00990.1 hypothetical protein JI721_15125 [Alicyclobacillus cycloheptanicus]
MTVEAVITSELKKRQIKPVAVQVVTIKDPTWNRRNGNRKLYLTEFRTGKGETAYLSVLAHQEPSPIECVLFALEQDNHFNLDGLKTLFKTRLRYVVKAVKASQSEAEPIREDKPPFEMERSA